MGVLSYRQCGVDIDRGNDFVSALKPVVSKTFSPLVLGGIGGFCACFELPPGYRNPVLCATTDGVGSKLKLAMDHDRLESIGIDLVAMCVNDLLCSLARPLFFLDYYATGFMDVSRSLRIIDGIVRGCNIAGCSLVGGESAELPVLYGHDDFDLAGFCVGITEKDDLDSTLLISDGDALLAFPSSGFHSNGYSLIRGVIKMNSMDLNKKVGGRSLVDLILEPTRIYVDECMCHRDKIRALAHITGGGMVDNLVRILPEGKRAVVNRSSIRIHPVFDEFARFISEEEMFRVFNMGVGMVAVVPQAHVKDLILHTDAYVIGVVDSGDREVVIEG